MAWVIAEAASGQPFVHGQPMDEISAYPRQLLITHGLSLFLPWATCQLFIGDAAAGRGVSVSMLARY